MVGIVETDVSVRRIAVSGRRLGHWVQCFRSYRAHTIVSSRPIALGWGAGAGLSICCAEVRINHGLGIPFPRGCRHIVRVGVEWGTSSGRCCCHWTGRVICRVVSFIQLREELGDCLACGNGAGLAAWCKLDRGHTGTPAITGLRRILGVCRLAPARVVVVLSGPGCPGIAGVRVG